MVTSPPGDTDNTEKLLVLFERSLNCSLSETEMRTCFVEKALRYLQIQDITNGFDSIVWDRMLCVCVSAFIGQSALFFKMRLSGDSTVM